MNAATLESILKGKPLARMVASGGAPPDQPPGELIVRWVVLHLLAGDRVLLAGSTTYAEQSLICLHVAAGEKTLGDDQDPTPMGSPWEGVAGLIEDVRCTEVMASPPTPLPLPEPTREQAEAGFFYDPELTSAEDVWEYVSPMQPMAAITRVAVCVAGHGWLLFHSSPEHRSIVSHRLTRISRADTLEG